jgi:leader peptidase (prepilin peptidase)/N-methyltransferase
MTQCPFSTGTRIAQRSCIPCDLRAERRPRLTGNEKTFKMNGMEIMLIVIFTLLGAAVGSFLNVCIDRLPAGKSLVSPPSFCDTCQRPLLLKDLIPLFSFLRLRRRCRYCGALLSWRVFLIEAITAALFGILYWHYGLTAQFGIIIFYFCVFIVILVIDLQHQLILNRIVFPVAVVALLLTILAPQPELLTLAPDAFLGMPDIAARTVSGIAGGAAGLILLLLPALIFRGGMGMGDVKMAALIGLAVGFPRVFVAILGAIVLGGFVAIFLVLSRLRKRKDAIPFGPYLSVATMATLVFGNQLLNWYLGLFS